MKDIYDIHCGYPRWEYQKAIIKNIPRRCGGNGEMSGVIFWCPQTKKKYCGIIQKLYGCISYDAVVVNSSTDDLNVEVVGHRERKQLGSPIQYVAKVFSYSYSASVEDFLIGLIDDQIRFVPLQNLSYAHIRPSFKDHRLVYNHWRRVRNSHAPSKETH